MLRGLLFAAFVAVSFASVSASGIDGPDAGNWTVGECILAQFAMEFTVHHNVSDANQTMVFDVPANAAVSAKSHCGNQSQALSLYWAETAKNDSTSQLERNVTIVFSIKPNETYYGVSRLYATFVLAKWKVNGTVVQQSNIIIDSGDIANLMFHTPLDRSYLCADVGHLELKTILKYSDSPPDGTKLPNSTIIGKKVQFDAFRDHGTVLPGFRTPMDCDYMPNDIVPIAVGITLALLIVLILIFYIIGRRRQRFAGYESV